MNDQDEIQTAIDFDNIDDGKTMKNSKSSEKKREDLLEMILKGHTDTTIQRVAYILNLYPETRDSDVQLQLQYWKIFESGLFDNEVIYISDYYKLTRLTTIARARATIQNDYKLFLASIPVQKTRKKLSDEENELSKERTKHYPGIYIFADESGKNDKNLIVGSVWFFDGPSLGEFIAKIRDWRKNENFESEFHFKDIDKINLDKYLRFADFLTTSAPASSYKTISLIREGIKNTQDAFRDLYFHLLINGARFELASQRISLPKAFEIWKDREECGYDNLLISELKERLKVVSQSEFNSKIEVGSIEAEDSSRSYGLQIADLFTGCVNRHLNQDVGNKPKDVFTKHFLTALNAYDRIENTISINDSIFHLAL